MPQLSENNECDHIFHEKLEPFGSSGQYYSYRICVICHHAEGHYLDLTNMLDDGRI
jgi:hypothetical protein